MFSLPTQKDDVWTCNFFASGISHLASSQTDRLSELKVTDSLYLMIDSQNTFKNAITLRSGEPKALVGYCPSFLSAHIKTLLNKHKISVSVAKINPDAPDPYRLLCKLEIAGEFSSPPFSAKEQEAITPA
jgi:hypothetical protein